MIRLTILSLPIKGENSGSVVALKVGVPRALKLAFMRAHKGKGLLVCVVTFPFAQPAADSAGEAQGSSFQGEKWADGEPDWVALCLVTIYTQDTDVIPDD